MKTVVGYMFLDKDGKLVTAGGAGGYFSTKGGANSWLNRVKDNNEKGSKNPNWAEGYRKQCQKNLDTVLQYKMIEVFVELP